MRSRRFRRQIIIGTILLIVLFAQFAIFKPVRDAGRLVVGFPVRSALVFSRKLSTAKKLIFSINDLSRENSALKEENNQLSAKLGELSAVKSENDQLRKDLDFANSRPDLKLTPVQITNYSLLGSYQSFTVNKGSKDGIKTGQAVVSSGYLIGRIGNVSDYTSEVLQLTNRSLTTPVTLTTSQVTGLLKGGVRGLVAENIPVDTEIKVGELVITSSLEGLYPSGIAVGKVEEIISKKEEIFISVRVSSPINVSNLTTVFVID